MGQPQTQLARRILSDKRLDTVQYMAFNLLKTGLNAGDGYKEIWIRDFNTFIELSLMVQPPATIRENLLMFFKFQGADGNIIDGFVPKREGDIAYAYRRSALAPGYEGHKNTVETDQEASLVQAVAKYVRTSGYRALLQQTIGNKSVLTRLEMALEYLMQHRYTKRYGLLYGATTVDWGDVQPEHEWGVELDSSSHLAVDVYDNAMFIVAINDLLTLLPSTDVVRQQYWKEIHQRIRANVRRHLWDAGRQKFRPHCYLNGSPFPATFVEDSIHYHGGTTVAIEAGLLTKPEIAAVNRHLLANVRQAGAASIGLTIYPVYPKGYFKNPQMVPYSYQNGGDWTWFGARMASALVGNGFAKEAYEELGPMLDRVITHRGFYEWYGRDGKPNGSGSFRGEAGVLWTAIVQLRQWANIAAVDRTR